MTLDTTVAKKAIDDLAAAGDAQAATLQAQVDQLTQQLADCRDSQNPPAAAGMVVGVATNGMSLTQLADREKYVGRKLGFRFYAQPADGIGAFTQNGKLGKRVTADITAGRVSAVSGKPGIAALANHQYHDELVAWFKWLHSLGILIIVIVHHEPENDGAPAAQFRESQRWVRACLDEATGGKPTKVQFWGCLMTYTWTADGIKKHGQPDTWNPGKTADGRHVWDACGLDHYLPGVGATAGKTLLIKKWTDAIASLKAWGCKPAVLELGVQQGNPNGGAALKEFFSKLPDDAAGVFYYDSAQGTTPTPGDTNSYWILIEGNGGLQAFRDFAKAAAA
jgi:hypothetical protein